MKAAAKPAKPVKKPILFCDIDHSHPVRAKWQCPECGGAFCNACEQELDGECPDCLPPSLEAIE